VDLFFSVERKERNAEIGEFLGPEPVSLAIQKGRLRWLGHAEHKDDASWVKWFMATEVDGTGQRSCPRKP